MTPFSESSSSTSRCLTNRSTHDTPLLPITPWYLPARDGDLYPADRICTCIHATDCVPDGQLNISAHRRLVAANLASELRDEIATKLFVDPASVDPDSIGIDADDAKTKRLDFDDIDDYHGWSSSPPVISRGVANTGLSGWARSVKVSHVLLADAATESPTNTGLKRVTVIVSKNGTPLCTHHSLHSQAADTLGFIVPAQSGDEVVADAEVKVK